MVHPVFFRNPVCTSVGNPKKATPLGRSSLFWDFLLLLFLFRREEGSSCRAGLWFSDKCVSRIAFLFRSFVSALLYFFMSSADVLCAMDSSILLRCLPILHISLFAFNVDLLEWTCNECRFSSHTHLLPISQCTHLPSYPLITPLVAFGYLKHLTRNTLLRSHSWCTTPSHCMC